MNNLPSTQVEDSTVTAIERSEREQAIYQLACHIAGGAIELKKRSDELRANFSEDSELLTNSSVYQDSARHQFMGLSIRVMKSVVLVLKERGSTLPNSVLSSLREFNSTSTDILGDTNPSKEGASMQRSAAFLGQVASMCAENFEFPTHNPDYREVSSYMNTEQLKEAVCRFLIATVANDEVSTNHLKDTSMLAEDELPVVHQELLEEGMTEFQIVLVLRLTSLYLQDLARAMDGYEPFNHDLVKNALMVMARRIRYYIMLYVPDAMDAAAV